MNRYSCNFAGNCEVDDSGIFETEADCQSNCKPSNLPPDLMYITEAYETRPWNELAPTDRRRIAKELLNQDLTAAEATRFLRAWQEGTYGVLLTEYPDFFWNNVTQEQLHQYLAELKPTSIRSGQSMIALATFPEFFEYRTALFALFEANDPILTTEPYKTHFYEIVLRTSTYLPDSYIQYALQHYQDDEYFQNQYALYGEILSARNPAFILELIRRVEPDIRQEVINDAGHLLMNKLGEVRWRQILDWIHEEFGIVPQMEE